MHYHRIRFLGLFLLTLFTGAVLSYYSTAAGATIPPLFWPTDSGAPILLGFGANWNFETQCTELQWKHTGVDIGVGVGRPVYAAEAGKIRVVGTNATWKGWVTIEHTTDGKFTTVYFHITPLPSLSKGEAVARGEKIGTVADLEGELVDHLHFGLRNAKYTNTANRGALPGDAPCGVAFPQFPEFFVDPIPYFGGTSPAGIYVADGGNRRIVRINDMSGSGWSTFGSPGAGQNQFSGSPYDSPLGLVVEMTGRIVAGDQGNHRIVRINDMTGSGWQTLGAFGGGANEFSFPTGVSVDTLGRIYTVDAGNGRLVRVDDMTGAGWISFGSSGTGVNQFGSPFGIFVDAGGRIYVADQANHRIVRINDMTGAGWITLGAFGSGVNQFNLPRSVFVDGSGRIYAADTGNGRIVRFSTMAGGGWSTFGTAGSGVGHFSNPSGVFLDGAQRIYVADTGNRRIIRVDGMTGSGWVEFGTPGTGANQFWLPYSIIVR